MQTRKNNQTANDVKTERDMGGIELINYGNSNRVIMEWSWSKAAEDDRMVRLKIGKDGNYQEAIIYAEEFMRYLRWA